eukprot:8267295-Heterocapsa_arctica.AAC.1
MKQLEAFRPEVRPDLRSRVPIDHTGLARFRPELAVHDGNERHVCEERHPAPAHHEGLDGQ